MLSCGLWQRRFGGDRDVIGRTIQMDGWGSVVVGVLPPTFRIYLPADAAMPTNVDAWGVLPRNIADFARDIPGVERVGGVTSLPLAGGEQYSVGSYGRVGGSDDAYRANKADYKAVLPGYFEAMGIRRLSGRTFERLDNHGP
jgi:hypothetical protein